VDCSNVHTIAQGQSSFPTSEVPSLHHRSKCAHHHPNTMQCLPSVHCHRINTTTHPSPLCFPGRKLHIHLLVGSRYPKSNRGFPLPQLQQVSACQPRNFRTIYSLSLSARIISLSQPIAQKGRFVGYLPSQWIASKFTPNLRRVLLDVLRLLYNCCGMLPSSRCSAYQVCIHRLAWLDGFRAAPHPNSVSLYRCTCHAACFHCPSYLQRYSPTL
jgi:hypothetical protein